MALEEQGIHTKDLKARINAQADIRPGRSPLTFSYILNGYNKLTRDEYTAQHICHYFPLGTLCEAQELKQEMVCY